MDSEFRTRVEIWINDKFFFVADSVEIKYGQKSLAPNTNDATATGTVIHLHKKELTQAEKDKQKEHVGERDYDVFYKKMVKRVGDPDVHIPVS